MSCRFFILLSLGSLSHVDIKKWPCHCVANLMVKIPSGSVVSLLNGDFVQPQVYKDTRSHYGMTYKNVVVFRRIYHQKCT